MKENKKAQPQAMMSQQGEYLPLCIYLDLEMFGTFFPNLK